MEQGSSWEANRFSASQEIPRILWNPQVHYHIHLSLSSARSIQSMPPSHFLKIHFNIILHLRLVFQLVSFSQVYPSSNDLPSLSMFGLITRIIFDDECISQSSTLLVVVVVVVVVVLRICHSSKTEGTAMYDFKAVPHVVLI